MSDKIKKIWNSVCRFFRKATHTPKRWYLKVKWFIQRGKRGYADCDLWNLDMYLSKLFTNTLTQFADETQGWPDSVYETFEDWQKTLKEVAQLPKYFNEDMILDWDKDLTKEDWDDAAQQATIARSVFFDWMKDNFGHLWD